MGYRGLIDPIRKFARGATRALGLGAGDAELTHESLQLPHWNRPLRVGVVADLHAGSPQVDEQRIERIVDALNAESLDVAALLGDYIDPSVTLGEWIEPETIATLLARIET